MKTKELKLRLTPAEHDQLVARAVRAGTTITGLVRAELGLEQAAGGTYARRVSSRWPVSVGTATVEAR